MSQLEEAVRPTLTNLIKGQHGGLSNAEQRTLAEWLTLKLMVAEHDHSPDAAMTSEERVEFFARRDIPRQLRLWLFVCGERTWRSAYYRSSFTLSPLPEAPRPLVKNVACVALGLGDLFALGLYDGPSLLGMTCDERYGLPLWPPTGAQMRWPPERRLNQAQALSLAHTVERFTANPSIKMFGDVPMARL